jgi:hypothetical protein
MKYNHEAPDSSFLAAQSHFATIFIQSHILMHIEQNQTASRKGIVPEQNKYIHPSNTDIVVFVQDWPLRWAGVFRLKVCPIIKIVAFPSRA